MKGSWASESKTFDLSGDLLTEWKDPFGLAFLDIHQSSISFQLCPTGLESFAISGESVMTFHKGSDTITVTSSLTGHAVNNFASYRFDFPLDIDTVSPVVNTILHLTETTMLDSMDVNGELHIIIDTASGLDIETPVKVKTSSTLHNRIQALSSKIPDMTFDLKIHVPIYSAVPVDGMTIDLTILQIQIRDNIVFDGLTFTLGLGTDTEIGVETGVKALFHNQPDWIDFGVKGITIMILY